LISVLSYEATRIVKTPETSGTLGAQNNGYETVPETFEFDTLQLLKKSHCDLSRFHRISDMGVSVDCESAKSFGLGV
jgi:hypothetical protein